MVAHPERHVGEHDGGDQVGDRLEDGLGARSGIGLDRQIGGHAAGGDKDQGGGDAGEHVPEVPALPEPVEGGQQDRHDHARLDPLPEEDHEGRNHVC